MEIENCLIGKSSMSKSAGKGSVEGKIHTPLTGAKPFGKLAIRGCHQHNLTGLFFKALARPSNWRAVRPAIWVDSAEESSKPYKPSKMSTSSPVLIYAPTPIEHSHGIAHSDIAARG